MGIPALDYTPVDAIPTVAKNLRATFNTHKTRPIDFRLTQLRKLYWRLVHQFDINSGAMHSPPGR